MKKALIYLVFYLKRHVLLLVNLYQNFRKHSRNSFKLDLLHYISTSGHSLEAMEKFSGVRLKLIAHIKKCQFIENMVRGGNSMFYKCFAEGNQILKWFSYNKPTSHIAYVEASNLYEHSI